MSRKELDRLIGTALVDRVFCERLLDGSRQQLVGEFDLTPQERDLVLHASAQTLEELAGILAHWLDQASRVANLARLVEQPNCPAYLELGS